MAVIYQMSSDFQGRLSGKCWADISEFMIKKKEK